MEVKVELGEVKLDCNKYDFYFQWIHIVFWKLIYDIKNCLYENNIRESKNKEEKLWLV